MRARRERWPRMNYRWRCRWENLCIRKFALGISSAIYTTLIICLQSISTFTNIIILPNATMPPPISHRFASAGIENPLVIKSKCFSSIPFLFENRLFTLSFAPSFLRLFRSSCSARTFAVKDAVSAFLILLSGFSPFLCCGPRGSSATVAVFFLFLLAPGAFLRECVRSWDLRV